MDIDWDNMTQQDPNELIETPPENDGEWDYVDEFIGTEESEEGTVNEVTKRIEQAKLYESLLNHDFFAPGSARAEIQNKVTKEIRDFILERLTILVGIKQEQPAQQPLQSVELPWDESQIEALTSIADRLLEKKTTQPVKSSPVVQQFSGGVGGPKVNMVQQTQKTPPARQQNKQVVNQNQPAKKKLPPNVKIDPATGNPVSDLGVVLYGGQVKNKKKPPKPMPSQRAMDMINQNQVQRTNSGSSVGDQILGLAITNAQNMNKNIIEED